MVSVKQLHESLNRLYEDVNNNLTINIRRSLLNEDIEINWPEVIFNKSEVESAAYKALTDSGLSEEVIESIDLDYDTLIVRFDMYDAEWPLDEIENSGGLYNVFLSIFNSYKLELDDEDFDESLTEARNPENDEVNDVIRRNRKTRIKNISDADKQILKDNGIKIKGNENQYPEFHGQNRAFKLGYDDYNKYNFNKKDRYFGDRLHPAPALKSRYATYPDFDNSDYDIKGWLDTERARDLKNPNLSYSTEDKPLDEYKRLKSYADDAEKRGRRYRKDLEAQAQNSILDNDDYYPRIDYESRDRAIRGDYEWADRLNNKAKKVASDAKSRSKYYKNESLIREGFAPSEVQTQYVEALEDLEEWLEDGEIDLEDILLYFIPDRNIYTVLKLHEYIKSDIEEEY